MTAGELAVITKAKDVCNYIITVTDKSPKKFRFTLIGRMQNYALDIIEGMIMANEVYVTEKGRSINIEALKERQKLHYWHMYHNFLWSKNAYYQNSMSKLQKSSIHAKTS